MENLTQDLQALAQLSDFDDRIDAIRKVISSSPIEIENKNKDLALKKDLAAALKKEFVTASSAIKEQESVLAQKEQIIDKYSIELNSAKNNSVYSTLIEQINKAKADISDIEDKILSFLESIDNKGLALKKAENEMKEFEIKIKGEIAVIENEVKKNQDIITDIEKEREEHKNKISKSVLDQYERIREGRGGRGLAFIENGVCSVCGLVLRPQLINMVRKASELVFCDSCSSILFFKE
jgi:predicted  nucleic acid-binding Zn-ribbon protein